jgi:hypothetical protein
MKRSRKSHEMDKRWALLDAEDRAVVYLDKFPPQVALATAVTVEWLKAMKWWIEQSEMIRRNDPREVFRITDDKFREVKAAFFAIPPGVKSDAVAQQHVIDLLANFPPDQAWLIARKVAHWEAVFARTKHPELGASSSRRA